jgi:hypothetical protein
MPFDKLAAPFGLDKNYALQRSFKTRDGAPKFIIRNESTGQLLFIGSSEIKWPTTEYLFWLLPYLNQVGNRLAESEHETSLRRYRKTTQGHVVVRDAFYNYFLTDYFEGVEPDANLDRTLMIHGLSDFHSAAEQEIDSHQSVHFRSSIATSLASWILPLLEESTQKSQGSLKTLLEQATHLVRWIRQERADLIDRLPATLVHDDYQPKNLIVWKGAGNRRMLAILDTESCRVQSRLFDFYFFLTDDDQHKNFSDLSRLASSIRIYEERSRPLILDEVHLLPNVLQLKAARVAAWCCLQDAATLQTGHYYRETLEAALGCIHFIHERRHEIRNLARPKQILKVQPGSVLASLFSLAKISLPFVGLATGCDL